MDWYSYIKKYVWNDDKTPYFISVHRLNKSQADHELFSYTFFIALLFGAIALISLTDNAPHGKSYTVALYALSVACGAVLFGATKHVYGAYYLVTAPLVTLAYFFVAGFPPNLHAIDELLLVGIVLILLRYTFRVVAIAKAYPDLPETTPDPQSPPDG